MLNISNIGDAELALTCSGNNSCNMLSISGGLKDATNIHLYAYGDINNSIFNLSNVFSVDLTLFNTSIVSNNQFIFDAGTALISITNSGLLRMNNITALTGGLQIVVNENGAMTNNTINALTSEISITNDGAFIGANTVNCEECSKFFLICAGRDGRGGICGDGTLNLLKSKNVLIEVFEESTLSGYNITGSDMEIVGNNNSNINGMFLSATNSAIRAPLINNIEFTCIDCVNVSFYAPQSTSSARKAIVNCYSNTGCDTLDIYTVGESVTNDVQFNVQNCSCNFARGPGCVAGEINLFCNYDGNEYQQQGIYGKNNYYDCTGNCCGSISDEFQVKKCGQDCAPAYPCSVDCSNNTCTDKRINGSYSSEVIVKCVADEKTNSCDHITIDCPISDANRSDERLLCSFECSSSYPLNATSGACQFNI
eukprot:313477_1